MRIGSFLPTLDRRAALVALSLLALLPVTVHSIHFSPAHIIKATLVKNATDVTSIFQERKPKLVKEYFFETLSFPPFDYLRNTNGSVIGFGAGFFIDFEAQLDVRTPGEYLFTVRTDDGFALLVDKAQVSAFPGDRAVGTNQALVRLAAGVHTVELHYFQRYGPTAAEVFYTGPNEVFAHPLGESSDGLRFLPFP